MAANTTKPLLHLLPESSVELHEEIGSGGYSKVWRATYTGELGQKLPVAAKKVQSHSIEDKEVQIMQKMNHKHIIKFYGVWKKDERDVYIIMELAERGDLRHFLNKCKKERKKLTSECIWKWVYEAASALQYFKSLKLSHRDIKSLNFLIMEDYTLKLGDLGLATPLEATRKTQRKGTCHWMAPEVVQHQERSPRSDIFSFGIVIWELVTTDIPYAEYNYKGDYHVMTAVSEGVRPSIPAGCPEDLQSLMSSCWDGDRTKRPDIDDVCQALLPYQSAVVTQYVEPSGGVSQQGQALGAIVEDAEMASPSSSVSGMKTGPFQPHQDVEMESASPHSSKSSVHNIQHVEDTEMASPHSTGSGGRTSQDPGVPMETESEEPSEEVHVKVKQVKDPGAQRPVEAPKKSALPSPLQQVQCYKMKNKPHGICVIINNMDFSIARKTKDPNFIDRRGSEVDAEKLKKLFEGLHYQVESFTNFKASDMYDLLDSKRQTDHSRFDCFICCVLTHGSNGKIYGCDGTSLPILKLTGLFTPDICNSLSGKPKLFIFESCLGLRKQGTTPEHDGLTERDSIPNESDFILGYATVPGHVAYRHTTKGSWYIDVLVDTIKDTHRKHDILTLLTMVNKRLSAREDDEGNKQTASVFHTLRKRMYLFDHPATSGTDYSTV